jgi:hypothetical protein
MVIKKASQSKKDTTVNGRTNNLARNRRRKTLMMVLNKSKMKEKDAEQVKKEREDLEEVSVEEKEAQDVVMMKKVNIKPPD